jgi:hypothetical protein
LPAAPGRGGRLRGRAPGRDPGRARGGGVPLGGLSELALAPGGIAPGPGRVVGLGHGPILAAERPDFEVCHEVCHSGRFGDLRSLLATVGNEARSLQINGNRCWSGLPSCRFQVGRMGRAGLERPCSGRFSPPEVRTGVRTPRAFPTCLAHLTHRTMRPLLNHAAANGPAMLLTRLQTGTFSPAVCLRGETGPQAPTCA